MERRKSEVDQAFKPMSDFDLRKVKVWGDRYSQEVYQMANQM